MNKNSEKSLIEIYAKTWETFDVDLLAPLLDENFTYTSQWVLEDLNRNGYIDYLRNKFDAIKKSNSHIEVKIGRNSRGEWTLALRQDFTRVAYINIKERNGKITSACMGAFLD